MRFISGGRPLTDDDIRAIIHRTLAMWDQYGYGPWAAIDKQTGQWVGRIGLSLLADAGRPLFGLSRVTSTRLLDLRIGYPLSAMRSPPRAFCKTTKSPWRAEKVLLRD